MQKPLCTCRPGERRQKDIVRFTCSAELVVVHDTEQPSYRYEKAMTLYKHRLEFVKYAAHTVILSNYFPLETLAGILGREFVKLKP